MNGYDLVRKQKTQDDEIAKRLPFTGGTMTGTILADSGSSINLGSSSDRWSNIFLKGNVDIDVGGGEKGVAFYDGTQRLITLYARSDGRHGLYDNKKNKSIFHYLEQSDDVFFETNVSPSTNTVQTLGRPGNRWNEIYLANSIMANNGAAGFKIEATTHRNSETLSLSSTYVDNSTSAAVLLYNEGRAQYFSPKYTGDLGLGRNGEEYRDIWTVHGMNQTSDIRAKENIKLVNSNEADYKMANIDDEINENDLLDVVKNINVYTFDYKNEPSLEPKEGEEELKGAKVSSQIGVIAQEIKKANPTAWKYLGNDGEIQEDGSEGLLSLKQGSINGLLISVVKTLIKQNEDLVKRIENLEKL